MDLLLQTGLPHQSAAVDAVADVFREVRTWEPKRPWENPEVDVRDPRINRAVTEFRQAHPETGAPPFVPAADRGFLNPVHWPVIARPLSHGLALYLSAAFDRFPDQTEPCIQDC